MTLSAQPWAASNVNAVSQLCDIIKMLLSDPTSYGSVPSLLQNCYNWTVKRHFSPEGELLPSPLFDSPEKNLLTEMRTLQRDGERLRHQFAILTDQLDVFKSAVRDKEREVATLEKALYDSESRELELKTKLHVSKMDLEKKDLLLEDVKANVATLHSSFTQSKEADTQKLLARTQDLREELKTLYENQRQQDELVKSQERELENFRCDLQETERLLAEARTDIERGLQQVKMKDHQLGELTQMLGFQEVKVGDLQGVISELRLSQGSAMIQDTMIKENPQWVLVRDHCVSERRSLKAEASAPSKSAKSINGPGEGPDVPPFVRFNGKLKPKALMRNDVVHLALVGFSQLSLPPASTPNLDLGGSAIPALGVAVGGAFSLESPGVAAIGDRKKPVADFSQRGILSRTPPFAEKFRAWLSRGAGDSINQKQGAELAHGILLGIRLWGKQEPDLELLDLVLQSKIPPEIHYHLFACVEVLLDRFTKEDEAMYQDIRKALPVKTCERIIRDYFCHPARCASKEDVEYMIFQMTLDCNIPFISYRALFEYDDDGDRGYFFKALMKLLVQYSAHYYDEIEHQAIRKAIIKPEADASEQKKLLKQPNDSSLAEGSDEDEENKESDGGDELDLTSEISLERVEELWSVLDPDMDNLSDIIKLLRSTIQGNSAADALRKQQAEMAATRGGIRRQMLMMQQNKPVQKSEEQNKADEVQDKFLLKDTIRALRQIVLIRRTVPAECISYFNLKEIVPASLDQSPQPSMSPAKDCMSVGGHSLATTNARNAALSNGALAALGRRASSQLPVVMKLKLMRRD